MWGQLTLELFLHFFLSVVTNYNKALVAVPISPFLKGDKIDTLIFKGIESPL